MKIICILYIDIYFLRNWYFFIREKKWIRNIRENIFLQTNPPIRLNLSHACLNSFEIVSSFLFFPLWLGFYMHIKSLSGEVSNIRVFIYYPLIFLEDNRNSNVHLSQEKIGSSRSTSSVKNSSKLEIFEILINF